MDDSIDLKQQFLKILDTNNLDELIAKNYQKKQGYEQILWRFIIHHLKKLKTYRENKYISSTNNKIKNFLQKYFQNI